MTPVVRQLAQKSNIEARICVTTQRHEMLDQILLDLPIMRRMGQHVQVKVRAIRTYEGFATDVKDRCNR